jgi:hypothetical protein
LPISDGDGITVHHLPDGTGVKQETATTAKWKVAAPDSQLRGQAEWGGFVAMKTAEGL